MSKPVETQLYLPVKSWLEGLGFVVKAEVGAADIVACRDGEDPLVVELKTGFSLSLLQQAVARQALTDRVYVAVPRWKGRAGWRAFKGNLGLCKRLGIGVLSVRLEDDGVQIHCEPVPTSLRKSKPRRAALLKEFAAREGDPNEGGTRGQVMTAYKQDALRCVAFLRLKGPTKAALVASATGVARARRIMADNHSGWFERLSPGIYGLSPKGLSVQSECRGTTASG
jgi:hypothetical protein